MYQIVSRTPNSEPDVRTFPTLDYADNEFRWIKQQAYHLSLRITLSLEQVIDNPSIDPDAPQIINVLDIYPSRKELLHRLRYPTD